jgi:hypothetical protein
MARDGFTIFDSDTHVGPDARILARFLSAAEKDRLQEWEKFKSVDRNGRETYTMGQRRYRRRLGTAEPDEAPAGYMAGFTGVKRSRQPSPYSAERGFLISRAGLRVWSSAIAAVRSRPPCRSHRGNRARR